jgi:hypothetical protein
MTNAPGAFHDRTQHLKATVTPAAEAANVAISVSSSLTLSNQQPLSNGVITFDVVGNTKSVNKGDASITATDSQAHLTVTKPVSVVVPSQIATPHPTPTQTVTGVNIVSDCTTSPTAIGVYPDHVVLITFYGIRIPITVWDQFQDPIGDIYDGAEIAEVENGTVNSINVTLSNTRAQRGHFPVPRFQHGG